MPLAAAVMVSAAAADDEWMAFGPGAAIHKSGETVSLQYKVSPGQPSMAVLPTPAAKLAGMTHLQFRVRTDVSTGVAVLLAEKKPGGDYSTVFWSPKGEWQQIDLTPADFVLNDGPKDPKDPDGRLDLDQVEHIAVLDLGSMFAQAGANPMMAFTKIAGEHKLDLEAMRVVTGRGKTEAHGVVIDDFQRGFLGWFTPGGGELVLSKSGNLLGKPAMEFRYLQDPGKVAVAMHGLGQTDLRQTKELVFEVASKLDAHMVVMLEMQKVDGKPGPRYNLDFEISGGQTGHMRMPFEEFTLAEDSPPDPAGHLDLGKVRSIGLADVRGLLTGAMEENTVWVADMRAQ